MPATRLKCPLPTCTWGEEEEEQDDNGELVVVVQGGGRYLTPAHLATIQQTQDDLKLHMDAHKLDIPTVTQQPAESSKSKPAKLDRPKLEQDMSE